MRSGIFEIAVTDRVANDMPTDRAVTHSLVRALHDVPGFEVLEEQMLLALIGDWATLSCPAEGVVSGRGGSSQALYVVISGRAHILAEDGSVLAELGPGDFFGEMSLLSRKGHRHDVR